MSLLRATGHASCQRMLLREICNDLQINCTIIDFKRINIISLYGILSKPQMNKISKRTSHEFTNK